MENNPIRPLHSSYNLKNGHLHHMICGNMIIDIDMKLPSLNEYVDACRENAHSGAKMKKQVEEQISWFLAKLPVYEPPVFVRFTWVEKDRRRDPDNVAFAKKFIFDAMVKLGKIGNDNRAWIAGFADNFIDGSKTHVFVEVEQG